jgi:hypothetical protein
MGQALLGAPIAREDQSQRGATLRSICAMDQPVAPPKCEALTWGAASPPAWDSGTEFLRFGICPGAACEFTLCSGFDVRFSTQPLIIARWPRLRGF